MTLRTPAILLVTSSVMGPSLLAQPIFHDSSSPQVSFAAAEVGRAMGSKRVTPDRALRDLSSDNSSLRFAIATGAAESKALAQTLRVEFARSGAQSHDAKIYPRRIAFETSANSPRAPREVFTGTWAATLTDPDGHRLTILGPR